MYPGCSVAMGRRDHAYSTPTAVAVQGLQVFNYANIVLSITICEGSARFSPSAAPGTKFSGGRLVSQSVTRLLRGAFGSAFGHRFGPAFEAYLFGCAPCPLCAAVGQCHHVAAKNSIRVCSRAVSGCDESGGGDKLCLETRQILIKLIGNSKNSFNTQMK